MLFEEGTIKTFELKDLVGLTLKIVQVTDGIDSLVVAVDVKTSELFVIAENGKGGIK